MRALKTLIQLKADTTARDDDGKGLVQTAIQKNDPVRFSQVGIDPAALLRLSSSGWCSAVVCRASSRRCVTTVMTSRNRLPLLR